MLKQVQHDEMVWLWSCCHPELGSGSRFTTHYFIISIEFFASLFYDRHTGEGGWE
jgi:hypothetical protein